MLSPNADKCNLAKLNCTINYNLYVNVKQKFGGLSALIQYCRTFQIFFIKKMDNDNAQENKSDTVPVIVLLIKLIQSLEDY